jgi:hypothetical protein
MLLRNWRSNLQVIRTQMSRRWEELFFLVAFFLLFLQVVFFKSAISGLADLHGAIAWFAAFDIFIASRLVYFTIPLFLPLLLFLLLSGKDNSWRRCFLDLLGWYLSFRLVIQIVGLNILVFDSITPRLLLITQLLFFLPYSLLVWGWIYWRIDLNSKNRPRPFFRLDFYGKAPRPIDYFLASFSSVFSASISGIKGNYARSKVLILLHGFMIYDVMGLTLSRAVSLLQSR